MLRNIMTWVTFPGVVLHELAHKKYCDWSGTPVLEVCYFRFGNPMGYVIHAEPPHLSASLAISIGPLVLNSLLCMILTFGTWFLPAWSWQWILVWWVGFSAGVHALPSVQDGNSFVATVVSLRGRWSLMFMISWVISLLIRLANALKLIWFDVWYAIGISMVLPVIFGFIHLPSWFSSIPDRIIYFIDAIHMVW